MSALGFQQSSGSGEFTAFVKYDARAGRWIRNDRFQGANGWESKDVDITNNAVFVIDLANIEVGWMDFPSTGPSFATVPVGQKQPEQPSKNHKQGFKVNLFSEKNLDGIRQWSTNAKCVLGVIDKLYEQYLAAPEKAAGKLPVIQMTGVDQITSSGKDKDGKPVKSTNYAPVFSILQWVDRPQALGATVTPIQSAQAPAQQEAVKEYRAQAEAAPAASGGPLF